MSIRLKIHQPRVELKFLIDYTLGESIRSWARTHTIPDPHGLGQHGDEYSTSSLYFDTADLSTFHGQRSFGRTKYRIRRYSRNDFVFLERKLKNFNIVAKRRTKILPMFLHHIEKPELSDDWSGSWFHRRLLVRKLLPVCQISYHRTAWVEPTTETRITLDDNLSVTPVTMPRFSRNTGIRLFDQQLVLEMKFSGPLPAICADFIDRFQLTPQSASKFQCGMIALGHIREEVGTQAVA